MNNTFLGMPSGKIFNWIKDHKQEPLLPDYEPGEQGIATWTNIHNKEEFLDFANKVSSGENSFDDEGVCLCRNIDLTGVDFSGIGGMPNDNKHFRGTFDGRNCKIKNMKIEQKTAITDNNCCMGLFNSTYQIDDKCVLIKNLILENPVAIGQYKIGLIVGQTNRTNLDNCKIINGYVECKYFEGTDSNKRCGGLIGFAWAPTITNCEFSGTIKSFNNEAVGGICGSLDNEGIYDFRIEKCKVHGTMELQAPTGFKKCYGGILAQFVNNGTLSVHIKDCYSDMTTTVDGIVDKTCPIFGRFYTATNASTLAVALDQNNSWSTDIGVNDKQEIRIRGTEALVEGKYIYNNIN